MTAKVLLASCIINIASSTLISIPLSSKGSKLGWCECRKPFLEKYSFIKIICSHIFLIESIKPSIILRQKLIRKEIHILLSVSNDSLFHKLPLEEIFECGGY